MEHTCSPYFISPSFTLSFDHLINGAKQEKLEKVMVEEVQVYLRDFAEEETLLGYSFSRKNSVSC